MYITNPLSGRIVIRISLFGSPFPLAFQGPVATRLPLNHGANIDAKDNKGRTALQVALESGCDELAMVLTEHGAAQ
jgi:hypothetical protein